MQIPDQDSFIRTAQWRVERVARHCDNLYALARDRLDKEAALIDLNRQRIRVKYFFRKVTVELGPKSINIGCRVGRPLVRKAPEGLAATN